MCWYGTAVTHYANLKWRSTVSAESCDVWEKRVFSAIDPRSLFGRLLQVHLAPPSCAAQITAPHGGRDTRPPLKQAKAQQELKY